MSFINNNLDKYTVKQMCKALKFSRSTYYEALVRVPPNKGQEYHKFSAEVKQCFEENKKRYGAVKLHRKLNENGIPCSIKRVQRHMQRQGLRSVVVKKYNHKASQGKVPDGKENILNRNFKAETINQKWVADITYIHVLKEGWTYLASVMDLYGRKIIGYVYGKNMTADLALEAVKNACLNVSDTSGIILHSDLGSNIPVNCSGTICGLMALYIHLAEKGILMIMHVSNPSTQ